VKWYILLPPRQKNSPVN